MFNLWRSVIFMTLVCKVTASISVGNGNGWGDWGAAESCPGGSVGTGFSLKVEYDHGAAYDDTGLNAIRIQCKTTDGTDKESITSTEGENGEWTSVLECPSGSYLAAFRLKSVPKQGSLVWNDDASATNVDFYCADSSGAETGTLSGTGEDWGSWGDKSESCPAGQAICGIQTRVEEEMGGGMTKDDTALNNVIFYCCDLVPISPLPERELQDETAGLKKDVRDWKYGPVKPFFPQIDGSEESALKRRLLDLLQQLEARR